MSNLKLKQVLRREIRWVRSQTDEGCAEHDLTRRFLVQEIMNALEYDGTTFTSIGEVDGFPQDPPPA